MIPQFSGELRRIGEVLRENHMPQETVNMILAARCACPCRKLMQGRRISTGLKKNPTRKKNRLFVCR